MSLTGNETLEVLGQSAPGIPATSPFITTTGAIGSLGAGYPVFSGDNTGATGVSALINATALANGGAVYLKPGTYYFDTVVDPGSSGGSLILNCITGNPEDAIIQYNPDQGAIIFNGGSSGTVSPVVGDSQSALIAKTYTITGATQAAPGIIMTSATHDLVQTDYVKITGVVGMTQLNGNVYRVGTVTATTFQLLDVNGAYINTTGFTAYVSGGTITRYIANQPQQLVGQDYLMRVQIASTFINNYSPGDVVHIHSQDILPSGGDRLSGESGSIVWVDYQNNYIFFQTRLSQPMQYFTSPLITRYSRNQIFDISSVTFTARTTWNDPSINIRKEAITVWGVPYSKVRNCKFSKIYAQAVLFRGSPYSLYADNDVEFAPNMVAYNSGATVRTITAITQANPAVVTTSTAHGFNNNDYVYMFSNIGGMTQVRNIVFTVANKTSATFELHTLNGDPVDSTAYTAFTSGGSVSLSTIVEGLGYGVSWYGASHGGVARDSKFRQCRHAMTTDGAGDSSYTTTEWYKYGQPTDITGHDLDAFETWGIAFDTHEEGYNIQYRNCWAWWESRGAQGGSYDGMGFQVRCATTTIKSCGTRGGYNGIIYRTIAHPFTGFHVLDGFDCQNTMSIQTGSSANQDTAILGEDFSALTYPPSFEIINPRIRNCGKGIYAGSAATYKVIDGSFTNIDVIVDANPGSMTRCHGTMVADYSVQTRTSTNNRVALMRSSVGAGGSTVLLDKLRINRGVNTNMPVNVFTEQDTAATKFYDYNEISDDNPNALAAVTILTTGQTTMQRYATITKSVSKTVAAGSTASTYTVLHTDNGQVVPMNSASGQTITVPKYLPTGFECRFIQLGAGTTSFTAGSGASGNSLGGLTNSGGRYATQTITVVSNVDGQSASYILSGSLA